MVLRVFYLLISVKRLFLLAVSYPIQVDLELLSRCHKTTITKKKENNLHNKHANNKGPFLN